MKSQTMQIDTNRRMRDAPIAKGCPVGYSAYDGGHSFLTWSGRYGERTRNNDWAKWYGDAPVLATSLAFGRMSTEPTVGQIGRGT